MTGKVSKRKAKRACIDCHFLMLAEFELKSWVATTPDGQTLLDEGVNMSKVDRFQVSLDTREQIKKKDYSYIERAEGDHHYNLGCYLECWSEFVAYAWKKRYETVVETDRSECFFFEYREDMSFEDAEVTLKKHAALGVRAQSNKTESVAYDWSINNTRDVFCNEQYIAKLPNLQFKLFKCLYNEHGKYVKNKKLEKCWGDNTVRYSKSLPDTMSKIRTKLKKGLMKNKIQVKDKVIEPKQVKKKNVAYKLVT